MTALFIKDADVLVTMDAGRRELAGGWLYAERGAIVAVGGPSDPPPDGAAAADEVVDARGAVVTPGLINTHHHLYQTLTRAVPAAQDALLFGWLETLYPIWARMRPEDVRIATTIGLAELALSGCTTTADHLYLYPNGARLEDTIEPALEIGVRLHATRGAMSIGQSAGGLPPDALVETEDAILADSARVVDAFHDPAPGAMIQIALAPCSPFSVSRELMRDAAVLAREKGVRLHTHLAENDEDVAYSLARFGVQPGVYAEELGWTGDDVWHAHCVKLDDAEIDLFARTGTGVAHCPCSNMRLGSGIAPVRRMVDAGVPVGLGVDGSASNDAGDLLGEARQAMLLQRVAAGADAFSAREALALATVGGATTLGRGDLGALSIGRRADVAVFAGADVVAAAGAWDPVAALVLTAPRRARDVFVEGRPVVRDGRLTRIALRSALDAHRCAVRRLIDGV